MSPPQGTLLAPVSLTNGLKVTAEKKESPADLVISFSCSSPAAAKSGSREVAWKANTSSDASSCSVLAAAERPDSREVVREAGTTPCDIPSCSITAAAEDPDSKAVSSDATSTLADAPSCSAKSAAGESETRKAFEGPCKTSADMSGYSAPAAIGEAGAKAVSGEYSSTSADALSCWAAVEGASEKQARPLPEAVQPEGSSVNGTGKNIRS
jgi:hypothetical protein